MHRAPGGLQKERWVQFLETKWVFPWTQIQEHPAPGLVLLGDGGILFCQQQLISLKKKKEKKYEQEGTSSLNLNYFRKEKKKRKEKLGRARKAQKRIPKPRKTVQTRQGRGSEIENTCLTETLVQTRLTLNATPSARSGFLSKCQLEWPGQTRSLVTSRQTGKSHSTTLLDSLSAPGREGAAWATQPCRVLSLPTRHRRRGAPPASRAHASRERARRRTSSPSSGSRSPGKHQSDARFLSPAATLGS